MPMTVARSTLPTKRTALCLLVSCATLAGCKAREMGNNFSDTQATSVDNSWIAAVKSCWPDLAHTDNTADLQRYLSDPLHFRSAFSTYSALNDRSLRLLVTRPVEAAPGPDTGVLANSQTPVLTRGQAVAGTSAQEAVASNISGIAPPDALCAVRSGMPVGFK